MKSMKSLLIRRLVKKIKRISLKKMSKGSLAKKGDDLKQEILKLYPEVFTGLGRLEPLYHMQLKENSTPVFHALRKIPLSLRSKLKKELDDPDGSLRLCLDPRDLNKVMNREHFQLPSFEDISNKIGRGSSLHEIREQRKSDLHWTWANANSMPIN